MDLPLNATERFWIDHIRKNVVPKLSGNSKERARTAAVVTWWALKEGILDLQNPWRHNLCAGGGGQRQIGDLETCPGSVWQLGMAGIQPRSVSLGAVEQMAGTLYPGQSLSRTLERIARNADLSDGDVDLVSSSIGELRKAWLLRDPVIAFELQRPFVERCLQGSAPSWCFGSWAQARAFASSPEQIRSTIAALEDHFQGAGSTVLPWAVFLVSVGLLTHSYIQKHGTPKWAKWPKDLAF